jgi:hypothetical protein
MRVASRILYSLCTLTDIGPAQSFPSSNGVFAFRVQVMRAACVVCSAVFSSSAALL